MPKAFSNSGISKGIQGAKSIDKLLNKTDDQDVKKRGRPKTKSDSSSEVKTMFILYKKNLEAINALAHTKRLSKKHLINYIIKKYLELNNEDYKKSLEIYKEDLKLMDELKNEYEMDE